MIEECNPLQIIIFIGGMQVTREGTHGQEPFEILTVRLPQLLDNPGHIA